METIFFALGLGSFFLYFPMEGRRVKGHFLQTKWDQKIPMLSGFVIPYILFFPYVFGVYIWAFATKNPAFPQLSISIIAVSIITTLIYLGYPSMMVRPFTKGKLIPKSWCAKIVEDIEKFDKPNNVFPSNHVAYSLVITLFLVTALPAFAVIFWIIFALIALSTILIKQHYLIDLPAGAVVALLSWIGTGYFLH